jgi:peroxiredoxin
MMKRAGLGFAIFCLVTPVVLRAQTDDPAINKQLGDLSFYGMPAGLMPGADPVPPAVDPADRPAAIEHAAMDIAALPGGAKKVALAEQLAVIATQGQNGAAAMQAAANTLAAALQESPQPPAKSGQPAHGYVELAKMAHFAHIETALRSPEMETSAKMVDAEVAAAEKADFTLRDLDNKKVTLSALKGKIVLVNFFSLNCGACLREMGDLEVIHERYASEGVVVLSVSEDDPAQAFRGIPRLHYAPQVLLDGGAIGTLGAAAKAFAIDGLPRTFVFDREGELAAQSLDMCTRRQFFTMLGLAGLQQEQ